MRLSRHLGCLLFAFATLAHAENGAEGWLRYAPVTDTTRYAALPNKIVVLGNTPTDQAAASELQRGLTSMLGRSFIISHPSALSDEDHQDVIFLTPSQLLAASPPLIKASVPLSARISKSAPPEKTAICTCFYSAVHPSRSSTPSFISWKRSLHSSPSQPTNDSHHPPQSAGSTNGTTSTAPSSAATPAAASSSTTATSAPISPASRLCAAARLRRH